MTVSRFPFRPRAGGLSLTFRFGPFRRKAPEPAPVLPADSVDVQAVGGPEFLDSELARLGDLVD